MKKHILFIAGLALSTLIACSSDAKVDQNEESSAKTEKGGTKAVPDSPCAVVSADDLRNILDVPQSFKINMEDKDLTYPTCTFKWDDTFVRVMDMRGTSVNIDMESEVLIVMVKDCTASMFDRSTKVYKDGVSVTNLGDQAIWGEKMNQLTFRSGDVMMHVHVEVDGDSAVNKEGAIKIAKFAIAKL